MRIGIIGLGDIAQKAYLPVITAREDIELVFCTRNRETLGRLSAKFRVREAVQTVEELIASGIDAAFIHSSTESHVVIAEQLMRSGVHVYVDKPISYHYEEAERLTALAEQLGVILMVGFNRRFAPMVAAMKEKNDRRMVMLQKIAFSRRTSLADSCMTITFMLLIRSGSWPRGNYRSTANLHVRTRREIISRPVAIGRERFCLHRNYEPGFGNE